MVPILKPYKLASSQFRHGGRTVLEIAGRKVGGEHFAMIAGPCTVESREQMLRAPRSASRDAGATLLRGGAYKPRTSPYAFQGLGQEGLRLLAEAKEETGLPIVTELMDLRDLDAVLEVADVIQIGARNMQNYPLLTEIGRCGLPGAAQARPVRDARGAADGRRVHPQGGQRAVMLCERGIRTFETAYRFTLDLMAVPVLKELTPPAGDRRPQPRRRAARPGRAAVAGGRRGRRRRDHRRGAPRPRRGDLRRPPGAARPTSSRITPSGCERGGRGRRQGARRAAVEPRPRDPWREPRPGCDHVRDQRIERVEPLVAPRSCSTSCR